MNAESQTEMIRQAYEYHTKHCKEGKTSNTFCFFCIAKAEGKKEYAEKYLKTDRERNLQIMSYDDGYANGYEKGRNDLNDKLQTDVSSWGIETHDENTIKALRIVLKWLEEKAKEGIKR